MRITDFAFMPNSCRGVGRKLPIGTRYTTFRPGRTVAIVGGVLIAATVAGCGGGSSAVGKAADIGKLKTIATVSSTVDPQNGDNNPYGIAIAPTTFTGDGNAAHIQPGDLVVSNFSNAAGAQWKGTTVEAIRNGIPVRVYSEVNSPMTAGGTVSTSGPVALTFAPNGNLWLANFGPANDGSAGNVQIEMPGGTVAATLSDPKSGRRLGTDIQWRVRRQIRLLYGQYHHRQSRAHQHRHDRSNAICHLRRVDPGSWSLRHQRRRHALRRCGNGPCRE